MSDLWGSGCFAPGSKATAAVWAGADSVAPLVPAAAPFVSERGAAPFGAAGTRGGGAETFAVSSVAADGGGGDRAAAVAAAGPLSQVHSTAPTSGTAPGTATVPVPASGRTALHSSSIPLGLIS